MNNMLSVGSRVASVVPRNLLQRRSRLPSVFPGACLRSASEPVLHLNQRHSTATKAFSSQVSSMAVAGPAMPDLAEGLEAPVQLAYLAFLLVILSGAAYVVVKQVLNRREMDERSKVLGELIRKGDAVSEDYFELGVVLARKRLFTQALKNYTKAVKLWDGEEVELAQVHNAMGYCYLNMSKRDEALKEFQTSTRLQPGYVTAWNNLADALEQEGRWKDALTAYESAYELEPENDISKAAVDRLRTKTRRVSSLMSK